MEDGPRVWSFKLIAAAGLLVLVGAGCSTSNPVTNNPGSQSNQGASPSISSLCIDGRDSEAGLNQVAGSMNLKVSSDLLKELQAQEQNGWELRKMCGDSAGNLAFAFNKTGDLTQSDINASQFIYPLGQKISPAKLSELSGLGMFVIGIAAPDGRVIWSKSVIADGGPNQDGFTHDLFLSSYGFGGTTLEAVTGGGDYGGWEAKLQLDKSTSKLSQLQYCWTEANPNSKTPGELSADSIITKCK